MSSYVKKVVKLLGETSFKSFPIRQEVTAKELFGSGSGYDKCRYDLLLDQMKLIIEVHGEQHYKPSSFGATAEQAYSSFQGTKRRDNRKRELALENDWSYLIIPYYTLTDLTANKLEELIINALKEE